VVNWKVPLQFTLLVSPRQPNRSLGYPGRPR
jgi:hypothetical protein